MEKKQFRILAGLLTLLVGAVLWMALRGTPVFGRNLGGNISSGVTTVTELERGGVTRGEASCTITTATDTCSIQNLTSGPLYLDTQNALMIPRNSASSTFIYYAATSTASGFSAVSGDPVPSAGTQYVIASTTVATSTRTVVSGYRYTEAQRFGFDGSAVAQNGAPVASGTPFMAASPSVLGSAPNWTGLPLYAATTSYVRLLPAEYVNFVVRAPSLLCGSASAFNCDIATSTFRPVVDVALPYLRFKAAGE